jgi:thiamine-phosphate pyrophosphorylase
MRLSISGPLYILTDRNLSGLSHIQTVRRAISAGVKVVQMREKFMSRRDIFKEAFQIRMLTAKHKVTFVLNDYIDIALAVGADGVHIGQEDMPVEDAKKILGRKMFVGVSTHNLKQALDAQNKGADYIGFGPMFETSTKDAGMPKGVRALKKIREHISIPIVAIGGISHDNAGEVLDAGADMCAVVSGILSGDIRENVRKFMEAVKQRQ